MTTTNNNAILEQIRACYVALDDKKAQDIRVLHVGPKSTVTDYYVIASGLSEPHLKALVRALEQACDEIGTSYQTSGNDTESGWLVLDAFDFMVHLFVERTRSYYSLENLWKDAEVVPSDQLVAVPA